MVRMFEIFQQMRDGGMFFHKMRILPASREYVNVHCRSVGFRNWDVDQKGGRGFRRKNI
jgi:hypothetical protein